MVDGLQRDAGETRERLKAAERDSSRKDKLLQEMLAAATTAKGVPGEALDQIRDDVQVMMNIKRNMQEARKVIEEKEQKIRDMREVLKATSISEMEDEVEAAKRLAKARAVQYAEAGDGDPEEHCTGRSRDLRAAAKSHVESVEQIDGEMQASLQRMATLRGEREKFQKAVDDHAVQAEKLREKCSEISKQQEQCRGIIEGLGDVEARHQELRAERDRNADAARPAREAAPGLRSAGADPKLSGQIFEPRFRPLRADGQGHAWRLASRLRRSVELGWRSGLEALLAEDGDRDYRLSAAELARGLESLSVKGAGPAAAQDLASALDEALYSRLEDLLNAADVVLGLPLETPPPEPAEAELQAVVHSLVWACRRRGRLERDLRSQLLGWLEDPAAEPEAEAAKLFGELGLPSGAETAGVLSRGLEARQERLSALLPSWQQLSQPSQASALVLFVHDLIVHRDAVEPVLSSGAVSLESFVEAGLQHLGSHWSRDELEQVALLAECPGGGGAGGPPSVDGPRLLRAALPDGVAAEFPEMQRHCRHDALRKVEAARKAALRRAGGPASRPGSQPSTPAGARADMFAGPGSPSAGSAAPLPGQPPSSRQGPPAAPAVAADPVAAVPAAPAALGAAAPAAAAAPSAAAAGPPSSSPRAEHSGRGSSPKVDEEEENYEEDYEEDMEEDLDDEDDEDADD